MELFVVNRYTGDEPESKDVPDESELRKDLIKKVKERKSRGQKDSENNSHVASESNATSPNDVQVEEKKKKKKKRRDELGDLSDSDIAKKKKKKRKDELGDLSDSDIVDKKKKKRRRDELGDLSDSDIVKKKKKKKRKEEEEEEEGEQDLPSSGCVDDAVENGTSESTNVNGHDEESAGGSKPFPVLGADAFVKPAKVRHAIPHWLANPSIVSVDMKNLNVTVDSIPGLDEVFVNKLRENNISHFFPVQAQVIPWLLNDIGKPDMYWPRDVCVSAPTGSGKTLAFVLPILQALRDRVVPRIRAVVVLPVQDLAVQVHRVFETYAKATSLKILLLSNKRSFAEEQRMIRKEDGSNRFATLVDVIVTTAGRLVDHLTGTRGFDLDHVRYLVVDEADRIVEDSQIDWLYHMNKRMLSDSSKSYQAPCLSVSTLLTKRRPPQKLLFSATLSQDPEKLQQLGLFQPKLFTSVVSGRCDENGSVGRFVGKYTTPAELRELYAVCDRATKPLIVHHLLSRLRWKRVLCFANSVESTRRLSFLLGEMNAKLRIRNISARLAAEERSKLIADFSAGQIDALISSDALARGIDVPNVRYVVSYDLPKYVKTYVHRVGRTGRAGNAGTSLILLVDKEVKRFEEMIANAGKTSVTEMSVDEDSVNDCSDEYEKALAKLKRRLEKEKKASLRITKSVKFKNKKTIKR